MNRSKDRSKSSAATETSDWTKEEWAVWAAWEEEGPAETEVSKPRKADKYAKEPKPVPKEGKLVLKRRAKAAAETEKQAEKHQSSTTGGSRHTQTACETALGRLWGTVRRLTGTGR